MSIHSEIEKALVKLGYENPEYHVESEGQDRFSVYLDGTYFGIWDSDKKTFVD